LHAPHSQIDDRAFHHAEKVADRGDNHVLDVGFANRLLQDVCKIFKNNDGFGAGVLKLILELEGRVQGILFTTVKPARKMAQIATGYCSTFGIMMATRAPFAMPLLCSQAPSARDISSISP